MVNAKAQTKMEVWQEIRKDKERGAERLVAEYGNRLYAAAVLLCANDHDAEGYLRIVGGTFTNKNAVTLGSDGIGTLEIGPRAKVAIDELVMSNKTASVMTVKLDATSGERANTIEIGRLVVTDGATISVDARGYDGKSANLFTFGELVGELPDIELISSTKIFRLNRLGNAVRLCRCDGTMLLFK